MQNKQEQFVVFGPFAISFSAERFWSATRYLATGRAEALVIATKLIGPLHPNSKSRASQFIDGKILTEDNPDPKMRAAVYFFEGLNNERVGVILLNDLEESNK